MIKPYYKDDWVKIYNADCLEVMKELPDKYFDLCLTDPPYGVRKKEEWDDGINFLNNINSWLSECLRISKTVIWFCADKMLPYILQNRENEFHRLLIWNKPIGSQFAGAMHSNIWYSLEPILVFGEYPQNDKNKEYGFACFNYNTISFANFKHPTTKPIKLLNKLIYFYSKNGDSILDPFLGSGTTARACKDLGRKCIGIEISKKYCDIAIQRLGQEVLDLKGV